ncbi:MAG: F0F1 ATP synthase subunit delta [Peptococcaceae bacterium]|nr:F0F1 ATP synthase subunit delta [Peptococcaceae bacterium]
MNDAGVAKRYAQALFMLADENQKVDQFAKDLDLVNETIASNEDLSQVFTGIQFSLSGKKKAITEIFKNQVDGNVVNFLMVLIEKGRAGYLSDITASYHKLLDERNGIADATVTTAFPLKEEEAQQIAVALGKSVGKTIRLKVVVDPALVCGVRLQYGDKIIDGSVEARLESMRKRLMTQDIVGGEGPQ